MTDHDDKLRDAYRALAREEPPAHLDAAILAAARREVARPSLVQRWRVPVSLAAVLVLAIGITLELQHQEPGIETSMPSDATREAPRAETPKAEAPKLEAPKPEAPKAEAPKPEAPKPETPRAAAPKQEATRIEPPRRRDEPSAFPAPMPAQATPAAPPAAAPSMAEPPVAARSKNAAPAAAPAQAASAPAARMQLAPAEAKRERSAEGAGASADQAVAASDPRTELERIAQLRHAGLDEEADRALEVFRRRYPDYRIDEDLWQRVRPR